MTMPVNEARVLAQRYRTALERIVEDARGECGHPRIAAIAAVALGVATEAEGRAYDRLRCVPKLPMHGEGTAGAKVKTKGGA